MIARLLRAKGLMEYLAAAEKIKRRHPGCRFLLVSRTETGPDAIDAGVVKRAVKAGTLEYFEDVADVRPLLASSTVYVLPSYREGTPRSVLEAMSVGRAIVTTDAPGCRETVESGVNGFTVPPRDAAALEAALECFAADPALAIGMGGASRRLAEEKFDVRTVNEAMLKRMGLLA
jgi:glycosyltransferase involved in cell wall biosynthesis